MKVDIEGAEEQLILSEINIWKKKIKLLIVDTQSGVDYTKIVIHLSEYNYKFKVKNDKFYFYLHGDTRFE